jgi:pantoate--beta-alanine ligase
MKIFETTGALRAFRKTLRKGAETTGFVPTMGALHKGHLSLVERAIKESDHVIVSIFVNPTQFNDPNDLKNYPRNVRKDLELLAPFNVSAVFTPDIHEVYPSPDTRQFDFGRLDKILEGQHRPGHFNGVAQVVSRLFEIVEPDMAFFGQKDYQQLLIVKELVKKLGMEIEIISCPIIREADGLAMSSRNQLLEPTERLHAPLIFQTLLEARERAGKSSFEKVKSWAIQHLNKDPLLDVEYFEIVNAENLEITGQEKNDAKVIACTAVKIGKVRLIDNLIFD